MKKNYLVNAGLNGYYLQVETICQFAKNYQFDLACYLKLI